MKPARGFAPILIVLTVLASIVIGAGGLFTYQKYYDKPTDSMQKLETSSMSDQPITSQNIDTAKNPTVPNAIGINPATQESSNYKEFDGKHFGYTDMVLATKSETYTSKKHKFQISYPTGSYIASQNVEGFNIPFNGNDPVELLIKSDNPSPELGYTHGKGFYIDIRVGDFQGKNLSDIINETTSEPTMDGDWNCAYSKVNLGQVDAYLTKNCSLNNMYIAQNGNYIYLITTYFSPEDGQNLDTLEIKVNQILSTFKFTE